MKRLALLCALAALALPAAAAAHPLGNFTVNRYGELDVAGDRVYVLYVLDLAEIPTFQAGRIDGATYARRIAAGVRLTVDGRPARLVPVRQELAFPPGQGGLPTTRLEVLLAGPRLAGRSRLAYRDRTFRGHIGWREVVVAGSAGARLDASTAPARSISGRLLAYPRNLLQSPPEVESARATVVPGATAGPPPQLVPAAELGRRVAVRAVADSGFAGLVGHRLDAWFVVGSLFVAFFWGAAHALGPGHGKSIVTAYLVGSRGTARHALLLGATVTVTHTVGVFALGLVTLSLSQFLVPEQLYPWLNLVSAVLVVAVGVSVLRRRLREARHHHHHEHDPALDLRRLLGVGISGGILPCPTALVVLLAAISLHRVGYGLVLIVAFSLGLAAAMSGIGILAVAARSAFRRVDVDHGALRLLPAASAVVVLGLGAAMTARALPGVI